MIGINILDFFTKLTGLTPTKDQILFLEALADLNTKYVAACAGRQTGKSLCTAVGVLYWIFEYSDKVEVMLMSPMDSYVYDHIEQLFNKNPELHGAIVVEGVSGLVPLKGFTVTKGSRVHVRRGTEKQIRGLGCDLVIVDEAAELPDKMITTSMGNLRGNVAKFVMLSTPHKSGIFTDIVSNPKKYNFNVFNWSEHDTSWHSKDELDLKKKTMSNQDYKMEVLGQVLSTEERAFFPTKHLSKCIIENLTREGSANSSIEVGIDFAYDPCSTAVVVTERIYSRRKVLLVKKYPKKPIEVIAPEIGKIIDEFNPTVVKADSMPAEYKGKIEPYTKHKIWYVPSQYVKDDLLGQLKRKILTHQLEIDEKEVELIKQLRIYRKKMRTGDDIVDALCFSIYEPSVPYSTKPEGRVIFTPK